MTRDDYLQAARRMEEVGGSFAGYIAKAYLVADSHNQRRLEEAFAYLFDQYAVPVPF